MNDEPDEPMEAEIVQEDNDPTNPFKRALEKLTDAERAMLDPKKKLRLNRKGEIDKRAFSSAKNGNMPDRPPPEPTLATLPLLDAPESEFEDRLKARHRSILDTLTSRLEREAHRIRPSQLPVSIAIMQDKLQALTDRKGPSSIHLTQVTINGLSREQAIQGLLGKRITPQALPAPKANLP